MEQIVKYPHIVIQGEVGMLTPDGLFTVIVDDRNKWDSFYTCYSVDESPFFAEGDYVMVSGSFAVEDIRSSADDREYQLTIEDPLVTKIEKPL